MTGTRLQRLRERRIDPHEPTEKYARANEVYERMSESSSAIKYAIGAMQPIDPTYTDNTFREGDRVRNQLEKYLGGQGIICEYDYQGSVTNDTHIKAKSDIDLLTLHCAFVSLEPPQRPSYPYQGDPVEDLVILRRASTRVLIENFPEATVDSSGSKSVSIEGGSLRRKIDVVASNWHDTNEYARSGLKRDRGIHILDAHKRVRLANLPFLHNDRLHNKDQQTLGGLRKAIRLLKSLKYDSDAGVDLSSYDIAAIVYSMNNSQLTVMHGMELLLLERCKRHLDHLAATQWIRDSLDVPNGTRKIFCSEGATLAGLYQLQREVDQLKHDIENDLSRSFRRLEAARIEYA
ncbi:hypothetical protein [Planctomicrobium sp. SH664]|uniref:hypothetical protein n=1 Tax=Planctomicrobium sp. SH664 TaxID=3448125 RepID=UPI003F5BAEA9